MIFNLLDSSSLTFVAYTWVLNDTPPTPPWFSCNELFVPSESYFIGQGWKKPTFLLARATSYFYQLQFWYLNIHSGCGDNRHWKGLDFFFFFPNGSLENKAQWAWVLALPLHLSLPSCFSSRLKLSVRRDWEKWGSALWCGLKFTRDQLICSCDLAQIWNSCLQR